MVDYNKIAEIFNIKSDSKEDSDEEYFSAGDLTSKKPLFTDKVNALNETLIGLGLSKNEEIEVKKEIKEEKTEIKEKIIEVKKEIKEVPKSSSNNELEEDEDCLFSEDEEISVKKDKIVNSEVKLDDNKDSTDFIANKTNTNKTITNTNIAITENIMTNNPTNQDLLSEAPKITDISVLSSSNKNLGNIVSSKDKKVLNTSLTKAIIEKEDKESADLILGQKVETPIIEDMLDHSEVISNVTIPKEDNLFNANVEIPKIAKKDNYRTETPFDANNWEWELENDEPRFFEFYNEKRKIIEKITPQGTIKFETVEQELRDAKVIIDIELYNLQAIYSKMKEVQMWRERLQEIQISINTQYFLWKRCIPMMQGLLIRIEHEKPILKNEANFYYRMGDMEQYYARLEGLKINVEAVDKTLSSAFDTLSRQLSINSMIKDIPTHYKRDNEQINIPVISNPIKVENTQKIVDKKEIFKEEDFDVLDTSKVINKKPIIKGLRKVSFK